MKYIKVKTKEFKKMKLVVTNDITLIR